MSYWSHQTKWDCSSKTTDCIKQSNSVFFECAISSSKSKSHFCEWILFSFFFKNETEKTSFQFLLLIKSRWHWVSFQQLLQQFCFGRLPLFVKAETHFRCERTNALTHKLRLPGYQTMSLQIYSTIRQTE